MPLYYFNINASDQENDVSDDYGTVLPNREAAQAYAYRVMRELIEGEHPTSGATMVVQDEARHTVFSMPF